MSFLLCPKDYKPCYDDLCRSTGTCFALQGEPMIELCPVCKQETKDCECPCKGCGQVGYCSCFEEDESA